MPTNVPGLMEKSAMLARPLAAVVSLLSVSWGDHMLRPASQSAQGVPVATITTV